MPFDSARDSLHHQKLTLKQRFACKGFTWEVKNSIHGRFGGAGKGDREGTAVTASLPYWLPPAQQEHRPLGKLWESV